jgi:UPF0271 protein
VIHAVDAVVSRAVAMVRDGVVLTADGRPIELRVDTICVHGDTPGAAELVARIAAALRAAGAAIEPVGAWL